MCTSPHQKGTRSGLSPVHISCAWPRIIDQGIDPSSSSSRRLQLGALIIRARDLGGSRYFVTASKVFFPTLYKNTHLGRLAEPPLILKAIGTSFPSAGRLIKGNDGGRPGRRLNFSWTCRVELQGSGTGPGAQHHHNRLKKRQ